MGMGLGVNIFYYTTPYISNAYSLYMPAHTHRGQALVMH